MIRFYFSFFFYFRNLRPEIISVSQDFFKKFVVNDSFEFFDIYFTILYTHVQSFNKAFPAPDSDSAPPDERFLGLQISARINAGFDFKPEIRFSTREGIAILVNLLRLFPSLDQLAGLNSSTIKAIATHAENYQKQIRENFKKPKLGITCDNFESPSTMSIRDLLFLCQEPIRVFIFCPNYKYCALGLIATLLTLAHDKFHHARFLTRFMNEILTPGIANQEEDWDCIGRFIFPLVQLGFECWGLVYHDTLLAANEAYSFHLKKSRKITNEMTYSFLNLFKFNPIKDIQKVASLHRGAGALGVNPALRIERRSPECDGACAAGLLPPRQPQDRSLGVQIRQVFCGQQERLEARLV